jgi:hypothetical protein
MKQKYLLIIFLMGCTVIANSQQKISNYKFHSFNSVALLNGEDEVSAGLQTVNGIQKGNWFGGIGVGLDYYIHRTVPLFADLRYEYGKKKNKFFAYADGGINFQWVEKYLDDRVFIWEGNNSTSKYDNGVYADAGFGYLIGMKKGMGLVLSFGYSQKTLRQTTTYQDWRTQEWLTDEYYYKLNRIVIKAGWRF